MSIQGRQAMEKVLARKTVEALLEQGFKIEIDNGGDEPERSIQTVDAILGTMFATDEDRLLVSKDGIRGWIYFVYGNDGYDVISDYTTNLEFLLAPINKYADRLESGDFTINFERGA